MFGFYQLTWPPNPSFWGYVLPNIKDELIKVVRASLGFVRFLTFQKMVNYHDAYRVKPSITTNYEKYRVFTKIYRDLTLVSTAYSRNFIKFRSSLVEVGCYCHEYPTCQPQNTLQVDCDHNYGLAICLFLLSYFFDENTWISELK